MELGNVTSVLLLLCEDGLIYGVPPKRRGVRLSMWIFPRNNRRALREKVMKYFGEVKIELMIDLPIHNGNSERVQLPLYPQGVFVRPIRRVS